MKKKSKVIVILLIVAAVVIALIISTYDKRVPFSRLHAVLEYEAKDIGAILFVIYDVDYERDAECVRNVKPRLVIGDKKLVKKHFDISNVPVEEDRSYIEKIYEVLNTVPKNYEGHEDMISSLNDTGLVFFTKDGHMFLLELILRPQEPPDKGKSWVAKFPFKKIWPIFDELFKKHKVYSKQT